MGLDGQIDRQTGGKTNEQTDGEMDRWTDTSNSLGYYLRIPSWVFFPKGWSG